MVGSAHHAAVDHGGQCPPCKRPPYTESKNTLACAVGSFDYFSDNKYLLRSTANFCNDIWSPSTASLDRVAVTNWS